MKLRIALFLIAASAVTATAQQPVTSDRILNAVKEPHNWLTYSGSYKSERYSTLDQITPANVRNLELQWIFQVRTLGAADKFEATPIVVDGVLYTVSPPNDVVALDAVTGRQFWRYNHAVAPAAEASTPDAALADGHAASDTVRVSIKSLAYGQTRVQVAPGTVVEWLNDDPLAHTVTADNGGFDSGEIAPGRKWAHRFDVPGTFTLFCSPHPFMRATIVVRQP